MHLVVHLIRAVQKPSSCLKPCSFPLLIPCSLGLPVRSTEGVGLSHVMLQLVP